MRQRPDPDRFRSICVRLIRVAEDLNAARTEYRRSVEQLAGCDLSDWPMADLDRYVSLAEEAVYLPPLRDAITQLEQILTAIRSVEDIIK